MSQPGTEQERLPRILGNRPRNETWHPPPWNPPAGSAEGRRKSRLALQGFAVIAKYQQLRSGNLTFAEHGVFARSGARDRYLDARWESLRSRPQRGCRRFRGRLGHIDVFGTQTHHRAGMDLSKPGEDGFGMRETSDRTASQAFLEGSYTRRPEACRCRSPMVVRTFILADSTRRFDDAHGLGRPLRNPVQATRVSAHNFAWPILPRSTPLKSALVSSALTEILARG